MLFKLKVSLKQRFLNFFYLSTLLVTPKQSTTPYHWLIPGYYKDKVKTSAVDEVLKYAVKIRLSKRIPLTLTAKYVTFPSTP